MAGRSTTCLSPGAPGCQVTSALPHKAHLATSSITSHPAQHHSFPPRCIHLFHGWSINNSGPTYNARSNVQAEHKSLIFSSPEHFQAFSRVERFQKGLPTTSLHFLQVSEAESQSITSCEPFQVLLSLLLRSYRAVSRQCHMSCVATVCGIGQYSGCPEVISE